VANLPFNDWIKQAQELNPEASLSELAGYHRETYGRGPTEDDYTQWERDAVAENPGAAPEELRGYYTQTYGEPEPTPSDAATALTDAWSEAKGIGGGLVGLAGQTLGLDGMRDWGMDTYERNMADVASRQRPQYGIDYLRDQGTAGDWVDAAQYHVTKGIPSLIGGLGAGLIGKAALKQGVKSAVKGASEKAIERAGQAGFLSGVGGYSVGQELGQIYPEAVQEQERRGATADDVNLPKVYGYGALSGAVETVSELAMLGIGGLTRLAPGLEKIVGFTQRGSIPARVGKIAGTGMVIEGAEEAAQTPLEYLGADRQLGTPEFWAEERQSAFAGALSGFGAATVTAPLSIMSARPTDLLNPETPADPTTEQTPPAAPGGTPSALNTDPTQLQQGIDARMAPPPVGSTARKQYEQDLAAAFNEVVGTRTDANQVEQPLTAFEEAYRRAMGEMPSVQPEQRTPSAPKAPTKRDQKRAETQAHPALAGLPEGDPLRTQMTTKDGVNLRDAAGLAWKQLETLQSVDEVNAWYDAKPIKSPHQPIWDHLATQRRAALAGQPPVVAAGTQTDILNPGVPSEQRTEISPPAPRPEDLQRWAGDPAGETPTPVTPRTDPGTEQATALATPPTLTDVVGSIRTALTDAKGITPAQRETLGVWLNTPDGSDATFANIGEQLGITKQAAHKRVQTALSTLRNHPAVKAFAPQIRGILSQTRAARVTEDAALTADSLASLASQNGMDQLDQRGLATTDGTIVDTADLAEGGNLTPRTTKTQIGLTDQQTDLAGGSTDAALIRSAQTMSKAAREALAADPALMEALQEEERTALAPLVETTPDSMEAPQEEVINSDTGQVVQPPQREPEPGELVWRQKEQLPELGAMAWDDVPSSVRQWFGGMMENPNHEPTQAWINDTIQTITSRLAPKTERVVGAGQGETTQSPARLSAPDGGRAAPGPDRKNAALSQGTEPGTNDYQPAQSSDEVAAASIGTFDPNIGEVKFGEAQAPQPTTRQAFEQVVQDLLGKANNWRITVHDTVDQALAAGVPAENLRGTSGRGAYGWVETKNGKTHATFILERVQSGQELSAFMHEVGAHMGLEGVLNRAQIDRLFWKIVEWGDAGRAGNTSTEAQIALRAMARIARAQTPDLQIKSEAMAYFVEEAVRAGVNPTSMSHKSELARWFRTLWAAFKTALRKLGVRNIDGLTAQHVVDMAYGAARLELAGQWHGTPETFRQFKLSEDPMGNVSAQGRGVYTTDNADVARDYTPRDGQLLRTDSPVPHDTLLVWGAPLSAQPSPVQSALKSSGLISDDTMTGQDIYTTLRRTLGSDVSASQLLDALGVHGTLKGGTTAIFNDKNIFRVGRAPGGDLSRVQYGEPSWAPPAQIQKAIDKLPTPLQDPVAHVVDSIRTAANKTHLGLAFTKDLADWIRTKAPAFSEAVDRYMTNIQAAKVERITRDKAVSDILTRYHALKLDAIQKPIAKFLADARIKGKWGYDPRAVTAANPQAWSPPGYVAAEAVEVDPAMAAAFGKLTPAAQRVVVDVNKLLAENFQTTQELITKNINQVYDKRIAQINTQLAAEADPKKSAKLAKSLAKTQEDQAQALKAFDKKLVKTKGPYAPLKRQGNYVVQAFSPELKALYDKGEARTGEETKRYHDLRRDEKHYTLEFVANRREARKRMAALADTFGENVDAWEKTSWRDNTYVGLPEIDRLRSLVTEGVGEPGNTRLVRDVENLALQIMADTHARQSQHHAKLTPGYDPDMIRAFVSQARADAHHIANLMYLDKINDAIQSMTRMVEDPKVRAKTHVDRDTLGRMVSELHRRWGDTLTHEPSPIVDRLAAVSSTWHLLLSPAYYFQNATQVGMMSVPWMAGTHGWATTQRAVLKAYQDILPMVKDKARSWEHFDTSLVPEDVRHVIAALEASGQINIFMDMELGQAATTSNTALGKAGRTFDQTIRRLPAKLETINRVVTAIAAYRLAIAPGPKQMSVTKATEYAGKVLDITHGDYDGFNAPRWISPGVWGPSAKLLFQFRKFQLIQLAFYARMFNDMTASHPPEVRKAAGKALAFSLAHTTLAAGAMGLPTVGLIQMIASLFGDDDEPNDKDAQDYKLRKAMRDGGMPDDMIDLVLGGLPTLLGIDMTGKLGSQHLLTALPYTQLDPQKQGNFETVATAALGPTAGMAGKWYRGFGDLQRGEYLAGFEKLLGPGVGDVVQAARLATKGERTYNTDQAFSPEELGAATAIVAGLGFTPEILSKRWASQRTVKSYEKTFDRRTSEIKRAYREAVDSGSRKEIRQARQEWLDLQDAKRSAGVRPSPMTELVKAPGEQRKRERQTTGGVKWDRGTRGLVENVTGVFD
jgi:hypothetical protein